MFISGYINGFSYSTPNPLKLLNKKSFV